MNKSCCDEKLAELLDENFFKALGDVSRQDILLGLVAKNESQTVSEIAECCPQSISVVSRHLKMLKDVGVLNAEKQGKEVLYQVDVKSIVTYLRELADAIEDCCG